MPATIFCAASRFCSAKLERDMILFFFQRVFNCQLQVKSPIDVNKTLSVNSCLNSNDSKQRLYVKLEFVIKHELSGLGQ